MRSLVGILCIFAIAGIVSGLETETNTLPWWPTKTDDNGVDAKADQNTEYVDNQSNYEDQDTTNQYENEIPVDELSVVDDDREAFYNLVNTLLWDADDDADASTDGRQFHYRRRGLMQRPMPGIVRQEENFIGQTYRGFLDGCYDIFCALGLRGFAANIARMFS